MTPSIKLSPSAKAVLRYYIALSKTEFYAGLEEIAAAVWPLPLGEDEAKWRNAKVKAVQRANIALHKAGVIVWKSGFRYAGSRGCRNHYWLTEETLEYLGRQYDRRRSIGDCTIDN